MLRTLSNFIIIWCLFWYISGDCIINIKMFYSLVGICFHSRAVCFIFSADSQFCASWYNLFLNTGNFISSGLSTILKNGSQKKNRQDVQSCWWPFLHRLGCLLYAQLQKKTQISLTCKRAKMSTELQIRITHGLSPKGNWSRHYCK